MIYRSSVSLLGLAALQNARADFFFLDLPYKAPEPGDPTTRFHNVLRRGIGRESVPVSDRRFEKQSPSGQPTLRPVESRRGNLEASTFPHNIEE